MSEIILDTITGKSTATTITIGSTPVVSASANSMTIRGEGSAQTSIQQGLAKAWVIFTGTGTIASRDSLNVGSITDVATGTYTHNFSNNMANTNYCSLASGDMYGIDSFPAFNIGTTNRGYTTSAVTGNSCKVNGATNDTPSYQLSLNGDLA